MLSYVVAGTGCLFAALCYAEFAAAVPVAGSAYTYAYATLGELFAWIIGWDLILEYAMACSTVASGWTHYLNELLVTLFGKSLPEAWSTATFAEPGAILNAPAVIVMALVTIVLVIGIRESATMNAILVMVKLGVVLFVIVAGWAFIDSRNWTSIPVEQRLTPAEVQFPSLADDVVKEEKLEGEPAKERYKQLVAEMRSEDIASTFNTRMASNCKRTCRKHRKMSSSSTELIAKANEEAPNKAAGQLGRDGLPRPQHQPGARWTITFAHRSCPMAFRASCSARPSSSSPTSASIRFPRTRRKPRTRSATCRSASSLRCWSCTVLYILVSLVIITGMEPYPDIDTKAAVAAAFRHRAEAAEAAGQPSITEGLGHPDRASGRWPV